MSSKAQKAIEDEEKEVMVRVKKLIAGKRWVFVYIKPPYH